MSHNGVHVGRDGWLFLTGGSNDVVEQYRLDQDLSWSWRRLIEARAERCKRLGVVFLQVVVPDKLTVLSHLCAETIVDPALAPAVQLATLMGESQAAANYVDLVQPFRAAIGDADDLYLRTDTHWSYKGCLLAYRRICAALGVSPSRRPSRSPFPRASSAYGSRRQADASCL